MPALITIQIVGWNSAQPLRDGVHILAAIPRDQAIIRYIDNASIDDSVVIVRQYLPLAEIIENKENIGFAAAHNLGFSKCTTPYVLMHDPDVQLNWAGIRGLLKAFDDPKIAAVQGKLMRVEPHNVIDSAGIVLTLALNGKERGAGEIDTGQYDGAAALIAVTGACGLYRLSAIKGIAHKQDKWVARQPLDRELGVERWATQPERPAPKQSWVRGKNSDEFKTGLPRTDAKHLVRGPAGLEVFDNDFFAYKEDVDLGWRLKRAGWKSVYLPIAMGTHARTLGARGIMNWGINPKYIYNRLRSPRTRYSLRNYVWMLAKNVTWQQALVHGPFFLIRLLSFFLLSMTYIPLARVWWETLRVLPHMMSKRAHI